MGSDVTLAIAVHTANTGLDAIKRAPIVEKDTGIKCLRIQDVSQSKQFEDWGFTEVSSNNFNKFKLLKNDILIARTGGSVGVNRLIPSDQKSVFNNGLIRLRADKENYFPKYIYYLLQTVSFKSHIESIAYSTSAQPNMKIRDLLRFEFRYVNLYEQKAIAHILGSLDDKIELNRQMNETLESMAQALFKSWFVDFDPVIDNALAAGNPIPDVFAERAEKRKSLSNGKSQARRQTDGDIIELSVSNNETASSLKSGGVSFNGSESTHQSLFPNEFEFTDEMGWIPKGWTLESFSKFAFLDTTSVKPNNSPEKIWEHYSIPAFDVDKAPVLDSGESIKSNKYKVNPDSILVSKLNPETERIWWVDINCIDSAICSTEFMQFIPENANHRAFIYSLIRSYYFQIEIKKRVTGSTGSRQRAQPKSVAAIEILKPSVKLIELFSEQALHWRTKASNGVKQNLDLAKLRDTLLPKLLSGELRIPEAEKLIKEAGV